MRWWSVQWAWPCSRLIWLWNVLYTVCKWTLYLSDVIWWSILFSAPVETVRGRDGVSEGVSEKLFYRRRGEGQRGYIPALRENGTEVKGIILSNIQGWWCSWWTLVSCVCVMSSCPGYGAGRLQGRTTCRVSWWPVTRGSTRNCSGSDSAFLLTPSSRSTPSSWLNASWTEWVTDSVKLKSFGGGVSQSRGFCKPGLIELIFFQLNEDDKTHPNM